MNTRQIVEAYVITVKSKNGFRYFNKISKKGVLITSCSLAGATMFMDDPSVDYSGVEKILEQKGYNPMRRIIALLDYDDQK